MLKAEGWATYLLYSVVHRSTLVCVNALCLHIAKDHMVYWVLHHVRRSEAHRSWTPHSKLPLLECRNLKLHYMDRVVPLRWRGGIRENRASCARVRPRETLASLVLTSKHRHMRPTDMFNPTRTQCSDTQGLTPVIVQRSPTAASDVFETGQQPKQVHSWTKMSLQ